MRRDGVLLTEILEAGERIVALVADRSTIDFEDDPDRRDALLWNFTVLGEAVGQLSDQIKGNHPAVGWASPVRMRNRIVHGYWSIDLDILVTTGWTMDPPAMFVALGTKQADGSYEAPMTSYLPERVMARYSILPDHSVVWITGDDSQQRQAILDSLKPVPAAERYDLQTAASKRLGTVPEVARQKFDAGVVVLRGSDLDHVEALCLIIDGTEECRPTNPTQPFDLVANVVIDGRWYFAGVDRNGVDWQLASFDGTPTERIDLDDPRVTPREEVPLGDANLWIVALPLDVDRVQRGPVIAGAVDFTGTSGQVFVRPDR